MIVGCVQHVLRQIMVLVPHAAAIDYCLLLQKGNFVTLAMNKAILLAPHVMERCQRVEVMSVRVAIGAGRVAKGWLSTKRRLLHLR